MKLAKTGLNALFFADRNALNGAGSQIHAAVVGPDFARLTFDSRGQSPAKHAKINVSLAESQKLSVPKLLQAAASEPTMIFMAEIILYTDTRIYKYRWYALSSGGTTSTFLPLAGPGRRTEHALYCEAETIKIIRDLRGRG
jgi:hypothetical protein